MITLSLNPPAGPLFEAVLSLDLGIGEVAPNAAVELSTYGSPSTDSAPPGELDTIPLNPSASSPGTPVPFDRFCDLDRLFAVNNNGLLPPALILLVLGRCPAASPPNSNGAPASTSISRSSNVEYRLLSAPLPRCCVLLLLPFNHGWGASSGRGGAEP